MARRSPLAGCAPDGHGVRRRGLRRRARRVARRRRRGGHRGRGRGRTRRRRAAESVLSPGGLLLGLATAVVAAAVIAVTVSLEPGRSATRRCPRSRRNRRAARGARDPRERRRRRRRARGGGAGRDAPRAPGARRLRRRGRRVPPAPRGRAARGSSAGGGAPALAGVSLARSAGAAGIAAAFLALAVALAGLAEAYRSTLETGERDQAAFAVPTDVVVREDLRSLVPVLRAAPIERYAAIPGVEAVRPVTRLTASAGPAASVSGVTVLGVEPDAIRAEPLWRDDWGASRERPPRRSGATGRPVFAGRSSPARSSRRASAPGCSRLPRHRRAAQRELPRLELGAADPDRATVLRARLPRDARGARLVGLELIAPRLLDRGADAGIALRGATTLRVLGVSLDGWIGEGGSRSPAARPAAGAAHLLRRHGAAPCRRAAAPAHGRRPAGRTRHAPPSASSPAASAARSRCGSAARRSTSGSAPSSSGCPGRRAMPSSPTSAPPDSRRHAVAGRRSAERALARRRGRRGGAGRVHPRPAAVRRPREALRAALEEDARRDPLGHGTLLALGAAALAALVLAVWGLVLAIRADLRDDRGELVDLEAQGATPSLLRRAW